MFIYVLPGNLVVGLKLYSGAFSLCKYYVRLCSILVLRVVKLSYTFRVCVVKS